MDARARGATLPPLSPVFFPNGLPPPTPTTPYQGRRRKAKLLRAHQGRDGQVPPRPQLAVHLEDGPPAQVVRHKRLVRFGQAQLPGQAGGLDRGPLGRARPAIVAGDEDVVGVALHHAGRDWEEEERRGKERKKVREQ